MSTRMTNRVLMLCHPFPPTGGAGVQRSTKFVKFLPEHGWQPVVITVRDGIYSVRDESLLRDIPPGTPVARTATFEPAEAAAIASRDLAGGYGVRALARSLYRLAIIPDRQVLWSPHAFPAAISAIRAFRPSAIYATGNPYSTFLLARLLSIVTRIPYVLDFRDPWTLNRYSWRYQAGADRRRAAIERSQEAWALAGAGAAIFMSRQVHADYAAAYPRLSNRFHILPNGFDRDDLKDAAPVSLDGFPLIHVGKLMAYRPPDPFLAGLALAIRSDPMFGEVAQAYFVGDWRAEHQATADRVGVGGLIRAVPYVPHREAIGYQRAAGALILIGGGDIAEQPGKLFEYLATERPILAIAPTEGAIADVLRDAGVGCVVGPEDSDQMAEALLSIWRSRDRAVTRNPAGIARYDRRQQAGRLGEILASVSAS